MQIDYSNYKTPIFPNINDNPVAPTANKGGNGADLINKVNGLIDEVEIDLNKAVQQQSSSIPLLTQNTVWYVDSINGNDSNTGLSEATAFATIVKASEVATNYLNYGNYQRVIQLMDGVHNGGYLPGYSIQHFNEHILIQGNPTNNSAVQISGAENINIYSPSTYRVTHCTLLPSVKDECCIWASGGVLQIADVIFSGTAYTHIGGEQKAIIQVLGNYAIQGSVASNHIYLSGASSFNWEAVPNRVISLNPNLSFECFASLTENSYLNAKTVTFNNSAIGKKYSVDLNSVIDTNRNDINLFPGDTAGTLSKNSYYF